MYICINNVYAHTPARGFCSQNVRKNRRNLSKMKKIKKRKKNFSKGYLQNSIFVVNYGKFTVGGLSRKHRYFGGRLT